MIRPATCARAMNAPARWRGWDGRVLRLHADAPCELRLDGVRFEPVATGDFAREFAFSPNGGSEMEFALHDADGRDLSLTWRVCSGAPASCFSAASR